MVEDSMRRHEKSAEVIAHGSTVLGKLLGKNRRRSTARFPASLSRTLLSAISRQRCHLGRADTFSHATQVAFLPPFLLPSLPPFLISSFPPSLLPSTH
eukprot:3070424-Rhodomonas_salina.1